MQMDINNANEYKFTTLKIYNELFESNLIIPVLQINVYLPKCLFLNVNR